MEPIGTIQGLASGIDFRALVDAIIEAESRPVLRLEAQKTELDEKATAWRDVELRVRTALDRSKELADPEFFKAFTSQVLGDEGALGVTVGSTAAAGSYAVEVLQLATFERVGSDAFQDRAAALGLSGEFVVGDRGVQVSAGDSLDDIAQAITTATGGRVSAAVVGEPTGGFRIVLTAGASGAEGIRLADGSAGLLRTLGFVDAQTSTKHQTSDGAMSDGFRSSSADVASLLGLSSPPAAAAVTIGSRNVTIDLATDSLDDIASAINAAAAGPGPPNSIVAQVVTETDAQGATVRRLDISGTTAFTDASGILETLGVLEAGRGTVAQEVRGNVFTDDDATTLATASTRFRDLWVNGADADVSNGDTLTISGTHGDGTTFTKTVSINGNDRLQDLLDELNSGADGFGVGPRTATAAIVDGALVVVDDTGGASQLSLSIVSNNEGGGGLDFGDFATTAVGRAREITAGVDAEVLVDGSRYTRSSNTLTDVIEGLTMTLSDVTASGPVTIDVRRDVEAIAKGIEDFVKSFNAVSELVLSHFTGIGAEEGESKRPLSGDRIVRQVRDEMRRALESAFAQGVGTFDTLADLGIEANQQGLYDIDAAKLREAVERDPLAIEQIFSAYGVGSTSALEYVSSTRETQEGTYDVFVSTPAERATVTGAGFGGTYVDDGTADTMTITDSSTGSIYEISLTNGMTMTQIVNALNDEFLIATTRRIEAANALRSDPGGTLATEATLLQDLHDGAGTNYGVANGDRFTISGTRDDGSSFFREFTVSDVSTQTLGTLEAQVADAIGADVVVDFSAGVLTATAVDQGSSPFTLSVTSDNAGGGSFSFGTFDVAEQGRSAVSITASDTGGELTLTHDDYGSANGFTVAYTAGGADGTASLGLGASTYSGVDVVGTIGGLAATGTGLLLLGDEGTAVEGLAVEYSGATAGSVGTITFERGIASLMEQITDRYMDGGTSSIQGIVDRLDTQKRGIDERIEQIEARLELRAEALIRRFNAVEEALARAQNEAAWIQAQLGSLAAVTNAGLQNS